MSTLTLDLANILQERFPHGFHAPADIDINTFLEFADDDWSLDLGDLLSQNQLIGIIWNIKLVLAERPDLTRDQAWKVLQACQPPLEEETEAVRQIVTAMANELFPKPVGRAALKALLGGVERRIDELPARETDDPAGYGSLAVLIDAIESLVKGA